MSPRRTTPSSSMPPVCACTPGLVNAATQLGLVEISGLPQTVDARELARFQPELRALSAINPHSEHFPVSFCEGITTAHVLPSGGFVSGRAAFVQLSGWTMPEMLRHGETGLAMNLPVLPIELPADDAKKRTDEHRERFEDIETFMRTAQYYARAKAVPGAPLRDDLRLDAMVPYVRGEKPVFFRANAHKEILQALAFADEFGLKPVIVGGGEAWKCAETLAAKNVPVIVTSVFDEPRGRYDRFDAYYGNPARLEAAGVLFAIASDGAEFVRQLAVNAGYAVAYGLSEERALRAVTLDAARVLGVDAQVGSLEEGKTADVIITTGNPLQASTRTVGMFMAGKPVELTSLHERSYEKFTNRPWPKLEATGSLRGPAPMRETSAHATTD
jgi:imidazolonepropionase-like amidohydrolase